MFYFKRNVPGFERAIRIVMAAGLVGYALTGAVSHAAQIGLWVVAGMALMTGVVGFCPMCAMVGRKLKSSSEIPTKQQGSCCGNRRV